MATYISKGTGNFTSSSTWAPIDSTSELDSEAGTTSTATSYTYSSTFVPGAVAIDGVAVKIASRGSSVGTISVELFNNTGSTSAASTTINITDIDASTLGWYFFKFGSTVTPNGTDAYKIGVKTSTGSAISLYRNATAANWSRMLRITSSASVPTSDDKLVMLGEWTGAGSLTSFTITMDNTATTSFGTTVSGGPPQGMV